MRLHAIFWFTFATTVARIALAGPEVRVRVHGASRIEATAVATARGTELSGTLSDEAGRPVADARLRVRLIAPSGGKRALPRAQACSAAAPTAARPSETYDEAMAETDAKGRFCLLWWEELSEGRLSLLFEDEQRLLESSSFELGIDRRAPLDLVFAPAPRTLSADEGAVSVVVQSRTRIGEVPERAPLTLALARGDTTVRLAQGELRATEAVQLSFVGSRLGDPGPGELVATLALSDRKAELRAPVLVTARVEIDAPAEFLTDSGGEGLLRVAGRTARGSAISSGSVEALIDGRTIGIAKLEQGKAELHLALGPKSGTYSVVLRYLPSTPWWMAPPERTLAVKVPKASLWRRLPWAIAWAAVAAWILLAWRRPARREAAGAPARPAVVEPTLQWAPSGATTDHWTGHVMDAHDAVGVRGARVIVTLSNGEARTATSDGEGRFEIPAGGTAPTEGRIRVEAPLHAELERPLPPPGRLAISLITRRRALLARLVTWAQGGHSIANADKEPTPAELAKAASRAARADVAAWATAVEAAAFGPEVVGAEREADVLALEPSERQEPAQEPRPSPQPSNKP